MADAAAPVPTELDEVARSIQDTLAETWQGFVAHLPFLVAGVGIVLLTWLAATIFLRSSERVLRGWRVRPSLKQLAARLISIGIWAVGLLLAAMVVFPGLTPTRALGGLGLASVAIGFAFKDVFENFFAGILLLWRFPFENGDFIECEGILGRVEDVTIRMTMLRKVSGELVIVPNSLLFKNPVDVLTDRRRRRVSIVTGVAYGERVEDAVAVIEEALGRCQTRHRDQPIEVFPCGFGASSIDIEVTWWTDPEPLAVRRSRAEVVTAVKGALDEAGIEIPFPYRTLTFKEPVRLRGAAGDGAGADTLAR